MRLTGKKVAVLVAQGFEDLEYWVPVMRLQEEGAEVISVGPSLEPVLGKHGLEAQADAKAENVDASDLGGMVVPGGWARTISVATLRSRTSLRMCMTRANRWASSATEVRLGSRPELWRVHGQLEPSP